MNWYATRLLLRKNVLLSVRETGALFIMLIVPFLVMLLMYLDQLTIDNGGTFTPELLDTRNPDVQPLDVIPRCIPKATDTCYTLAFAPNTRPDVSAWVEQVRANNAIPKVEVISFADQDLLNEHLRTNPNMTQAAYVFNDYTLDRLADGDVSFIVQYNHTVQSVFPLGFSFYDREVVIPSMVSHMNNVIMSNMANRSINISVSVSKFPHPNIVDGVPVDAFGNNGALLTFATYFVVLVFFLFRIVEEKERGLRDALRLAGQTQLQHYISWTIPFLMLNLVVTLLLIVLGAMFGFDLFRKIQFGLYFLTMFIFSLSIIGWTFFLASLINKSFSVNTISFNIFIFGYLIGTSASIVYDDDLETPAVLRPLFAISPITMYVRTIDYLALQSNLPSPTIKMSEIGNLPDVYPILTSWSWMFFSGLIAYLLSIYLDNVVRTPHGTPSSPLYFLQPSYWRPRKPDINFDSDTTPDEAEVDPLVQQEEDDLHARASIRYDPNVEDEDVRAERVAIANDQRADAALLINGVSKKFSSHLAVDDVSFSVARNTAFALLGANGAGKSTLFKCLTTTLSATAGDAYIYGLSAKKDREAVRKLIGVCPQFDIFWTKLTGAEHIRLFAALRGYTPQMCEREIEERLADVDLWNKKADTYAGDYSGGMQRRLSVAIALTGNPRLVFLDECTSGADPLVRRDLWASIQRAKKGRVIFLITHSIAEAQYIAGHNRIGIMAQGKMRVLGNAMRLKTKFGAGLSLVAVVHGDDSTVQRLFEGLKNQCSEVAYIGTTQGEREGDLVASFAFPRGTPDSLVVAAIQFVETEQNAYGVRDYSINSTTLGEVFKSITSLSEDVAEKGDELTVQPERGVGSQVTES